MNKYPTLGDSLEIDVYVYIAQYNVR